MEEMERTRRGGRIVDAVFNEAGVVAVPATATTLGDSSVMAMS